MYCGIEVKSQEGMYICKEHREYGTFDVIYDYSAISEEMSPFDLEKKPFWRGMQRYLPLLPINQTESELPRINVGGTPIHKLKPLKFCQER
ncbi:hypothetical protein [Candidatus Spongiihabitans sp.]|uniref:hypothetical protein n=1 Tax=Candidatus Spongiihabitans sp. TaxID=3101308 RepID=UPI003C6F29F4